MKVLELVENISKKDFNLAESLQVKTYLPIEVKRTIAEGIIYECTSDEDGAIRVDSVQRYMSYVRYMIIMHTNLEYTDEYYDILCSTEYMGTSLLNAIIDCFIVEAQECSKILNFMFEDYLRENSFEFTAVKLLNKIMNSFNGFGKVLNDKINDLDLEAIMNDIDTDGLNKFLNEYIK